MSTLQEIKTAISHLNAHDQAVLAAELFAMDLEPHPEALEAASLPTDEYVVTLESTL
jgi:hypothetical protein